MFFKIKEAKEIKMKCFLCTLNCFLHIITFGQFKNKIDIEVSTESYEQILFGDDVLAKKKAVINKEKDILTDMKKRAFERAWRVRDFEIERYWQRSLYFWGFIVAIFTAYAASFSIGNSQIFLPLVLSFSGIVFSFAFYLANKGSKFWQGNWESHIDMLEDEIEGKIYKTVFVEENTNVLLSGGAYSVSKINTFLSLFLTVFWCGIFLKSTTLYDGLFKQNDLCTFGFYFLLTIALLLPLIFFLCFMNCCVKSSFPEKDKNDIEKIFRVFDRDEDKYRYFKKEVKKSE